MEDSTVKTETLAETENYAVWISQDEDELMFHIEIGIVTLNFLQEEWDEFVKLMAALPKGK